MSLKDRIQDDMKTAMRAKDKERLGAIRLILAAVKQREVDERIELNDVQVLGVLEKMIKQRRESLAQYQSAGREDLAARESFEIEVIQSYLPTPLSEADIDTLVANAVAVTGAQSVRDMGKVMALIKDQAQGRVDMAKISARVKAHLDT
ncbi:GatB/YqeY domain-containing protein [Candidatus Competibacter phosphatis]|uniref:GatB/YqeY domain-containing protein n=1 Tax=Candidatus Competibacter phosphatis TaxID=221280 RepID=A0ABX1TNA6_9GAMM|nr:GatB/YqeY domain-containing protein [Candidatus Competibacter phosphatis]NMQ19925.1 GatB/YqeY domain-containing protein [Candidatus Competibacter phosphatis]